MDGEQNGTQAQQQIEQQQESSAAEQQAQEQQEARGQHARAEGDNAAKVTTPCRTERLNAAAEVPL